MGFAEDCSDANEIGIRMALGAEQRRILWMVLREVLLLVAAGMAIGFAHGGCDHSSDRKHALRT
jgi:hypothetical protein